MKRPETETTPGTREVLVMDAGAARVPEDELASIEERERDVAAEILGVLSELGDDSGSAKVSIHRLNSQRGTSEYLDDWLPSEFSMKRLSEEFGGGTYNVRVYVPNMVNGVQRGVKLAKNGRVVVGGKARETGRELVPIAAPSGPVGIEAIANVFASSLQELGKLIVESRGEQKSPVQQLKEMLELQVLIKGLQPESPKQIDPFELLERVSNLQEKLGLTKGAADGDGGSMGMLFLKEIMPALKGMAESARVSNERQPAALIAEQGEQVLDAAQPPPAPAVVTANAIEQEDDMDASRLIYKGYVAILCENARRNTPVADYAPEVLDNVPDSMYEDFMTLVKSENFMAKLIEFNAKASLYRAWFDQLQKELIRLDALPPE